MKRTSKRPKFTGARFPIEIGEVKHLRSGQMQIQVVVPYEGKAEALKLTDTSGMLLEASVSPVEGVIE